MAAETKALTFDEQEAQVQWEDLFEQAEQGCEFVITRKGKTVACLVPPQNARGDEKLMEQP